MSWHCSLALVEEFSRGVCWGASPTRKGRRKGSSQRPPHALENLILEDGDDRRQGDLIAIPASCTPRPRI